MGAERTAGGAPGYAAHVEPDRLTTTMRTVNCLVATVCLASAQWHGVAQTSKPEYGIREDTPRTGSMIRRYNVEGSSVPINKRYSEFTAEEKDRLNRYYETMVDGDEPPFPIDGLRPVYDAIRKAQAKLLVTGNLRLLVTVDSNGQAKEIKIIESPDPEMTRFAASILFLTKYKPALCQGQACSMDYPFGFTFKVE